MRYLNPKADLTFKKVFGEHPDLIISFLNALLPFEQADEMIQSVEYLNPELVPQNPLRKDSIVDVRCTDQLGRQFIVEMQMMWTSAYKQRVLFNASKAYVSQLESGQGYELLQPVYSVNLVNDVFSKSEAYYHDYRIVEVAETKEVIDGLRFIFIELPKFTPHSYSDRRMLVLWLRYLTEIDEQTSSVPQELLDDPFIGKAVMQLEESAFSKEQLLGYEKFWDIVSTAKTTISSARNEGREEGLMQGREEGLMQGREEGLMQGREEGLMQGREEGLMQGREEGLMRGREEERMKLVRSMRAAGISCAVIASVTEMSVDEVEMLQ